MRFDFPIFLSITFYVRNKKIFQFHLQFNLILKYHLKEVSDSGCLHITLEARIPLKMSVKFVFLNPLILRFHRFHFYVVVP